MPDLSRGREAEIIDFLIEHLKDFDRSKGVWYTQRNLMQSIVKISKRKDLADLFVKVKSRPLNTKDEELLRLTELFISMVYPESTSK